MATEYEPRSVGGGLSTYTLKDASFGASAGVKYAVDCSGGAITVTLPTSPVEGDSVVILDAMGSAATHNITIIANRLIDELEDNLVIDSNNTKVELVYAGGNKGWQVVHTNTASGLPTSLTPSANVKFGAAAGAGITDVLPAAPAAGDKAKYYIKPTGDHTLDFDTAILKPTDSGLTLPKTMTSGKTYVVLMEFNGTAWMLVSLVGGYA